MFTSGYRGVLEVRAVRSIFIWLIGLVYFGLFCLITILISYFFDNRKIDTFVRNILKPLFKLMFIKVEVEGADKLDRNKVYLLMSNHVSLFDVPFLKAFIPVHFIGVEAHHQFDWPIYGWLIKRMNTIPIKRDNIHASMKSIKKALKALRSGTSIAILPEGHRTLDGEMREFKKLPFYLAKKAEVDLVPIGLSGLYSLKPKRSWHIRPGKIKIKFGEIITSDQIKNMEVEEIRDLTYARIKSLIEWI